MIVLVESLKFSKSVSTMHRLRNIDCALVTGAAVVEPSDSSRNGQIKPLEFNPMDFPVEKEFYGYDIGIESNTL